MIRHALACALACCAGLACGDDHGPPSPDAAPDLGPQGIAQVTVSHYDYRFELSTRAAHTTLSLQLVTAGNCVALAYKGPAPTAVRFGDEVATAVDTAGGMLTACTTHGEPAGARMTLEADLVVDLATLSTSQVGYSVSEDAAGNPLSYLLDWVGECSRFTPCDADPGVFATYTFHVTHDAALTVRCSGDITEVSPTETQCDFEHPGGPTYSTFGFIAYPHGPAAWMQHDLGLWGSAHVTLYDRDATGTLAEIDGPYHAGFVAWMESTFGPYPFGTDLRLLVAPTYWAGFEHPGNIVIDDLLAGLAGTYDVAHTLDHEMAHQWAGDQTTIASTYDFVWKESMAEYLAFAYEAQANPAFATLTARAWKQNSIGAQFYPVPLDHPALFNYYDDVYGPGPLVLFRQLEVLSSREQVIAALQDVLGAQRALSVDELLAALAAHTGLDLTAYAATWIRGHGAPTYPHVRATFAAGAGATSTVAIATPIGGDHGCKFHIALRGAGGAAAGEEQLVEVDTFRDGPTQSLTVPSPAFPVTSIVLDPLAECLVLQASGATVALGHIGRRPWLSPRVK